MRREIGFWKIKLRQCGIKRDEIVVRFQTRLVLGLRDALGIEQQRELVFELTWGKEGEILGIAIAS